MSSKRDSPSSNSLDDVLAQTHVPGQASQHSRRPGPASQKPPSGGSGSFFQDLFAEEHHQTLRLLVGLCIVIGMTLLWHSINAVPSVPNYSEEYAHIGEFEQLHPMDSGGWFAQIQEPLRYLSAQERLQRCRSILTQLPPENGYSLILIDSSNNSIACQRN